MDDSEHGDVSHLPELQTGEQEPLQSSGDEWTIEKVIADLDRDFDGTLPEEALREAQRRGDEIVPHLIELVRKATALIREGGERPAGSGHLFAVYLLAEFQAKESLPAIVESLSLPSDGAHDLYGDAITQDFGRILAVLASDSPERIEELIANRSLDEYVRWEAAHTYLYWVRDGRWTREQAVEKLRQHLRATIANEEVELISPLVCELESYAPREAIEEIRQAYRLELVDESMIDMDSIEQSLEDGDSRWQKTLEFCQPTGIQDSVEEFRKWYCFRDRDADNEESAEDFINPVPAPARFLDDGPFPLADDLDDQFDDWGEDIPDTPPTTFRHTEAHVGRNSPCPCGSGKKFKKCCGAN